jgi:hypothetical protein
MGIVLTNWKAAFLRERGTSFLIIEMLLLIAAFLFDYGFATWRGSSRDLEDVGELAGVVGILLLIACFAVLRLQRGVRTKPLFFCLPGYRESLRILTFSAAIVFGVAWSVFREPLRRPATSAEIGLDLVGGLLTGIVFYLALGGTPRLILSRRISASLRLAAIPLLLVLSIVFSEARNAPLAIWPILILVLSAACVFAWIRLGDIECIKRGQRIILEDAIERGPVPGSPRTTLPWVEKWLASQMERQSYLHAGRYVWGELYAAIGRLLHYWKWVLGAILGCAWILGDMGQSAANVVFAASGFLACMPRSPVLSPMALPGGRKERLKAALGTAVAGSLLLMTAASAVVVLSWLMTPFLGGAPADGGLRAHGVLRACLLVPWFSAFGLLGSRMPSLGQVGLIIGFTVAFAQHFLTAAAPILPTWVQWIAPAGVLAGGWLFLLLVLWVVSIRWDLAGQRPTRDE